MSYRAVLMCKHYTFMYTHYMSAIICALALKSILLRISRELHNHILDLQLFLTL